MSVRGTQHGVFFIKMQLAQEEKNRMLCHLVILPGRKDKKKKSNVSFYIQKYEHMDMFCKQKEEQAVAHSNANEPH